MEHLPNDHKDHTNQHENSHKLCDETGHPALSLLESQWKLRQTHIRISRWGKSHCRTNTSVRRKKKFKRAGLREPQSGIPAGKLTI